MDQSDYPPFVVSVLLAVLFCVFWLHARRIPRRKLRLPAQIFTAGLVLFASFVFGLLLLSEDGCEARGPKVWSPDAHYVALPTWGLQGALGADEADVYVRRRSSLDRVPVYSASGIEFRDPTVFWRDSRHLVISYDPTHKEAGSAYEVHCKDRVYDLFVSCEPTLHEWSRVAPIKSEKR